MTTAFAHMARTPKTLEPAVAAREFGRLLSQAAAKAAAERTDDHPARIANDMTDAVVRRLDADGELDLMRDCMADFQRIADVAPPLGETALHPAADTLTVQFGWPHRWQCMPDADGRAISPLPAVAMERVWPNAVPDDPAHVAAWLMLWPAAFHSLDLVAPTFGAAPTPMLFRPLHTPRLGEMLRRAGPRRDGTRLEVKANEYRAGRSEPLQLVTSAPMRAVMAPLFGALDIAGAILGVHCDKWVLNPNKAHDIALRTSADGSLQECFAAIYDAKALRRRGWRPGADALPAGTWKKLMATRYGAKRTHTSRSLSEHWLAGTLVQFTLAMTPGHIGRACCWSIADNIGKACRSGHPDYREVRFAVRTIAHAVVERRIHTPRPLGSFERRDDVQTRAALAAIGTPDERRMLG